MRLEQIEQKSTEQLEKAETLQEEAADHKQRIEQLEHVAKELQESLSHVDSEGVREAIQQVEESKRETERQLEAVREEKATLVNENESLQERTGQSIEKRQKASERIPALCGLNASARSTAIGAMVDKMGQAMRNDLQHLERTHQELQTAKQRLEAIEV